MNSYTKREHLNGYANPHMNIYCSSVAEIKLKHKTARNAVFTKFNERKKKKIDIVKTIRKWTIEGRHTDDLFGHLIDSFEGVSFWINIDTDEIKYEFDDEFM